jgi:hypothetical protein
MDAARLIRLRLDDRPYARAVEDCHRAHAAHALVVGMLSKPDKLFHHRRRGTSRELPARVIVAKLAAWVPGDTFWSPKRLVPRLHDR